MVNSKKMYLVNLLFKFVPLTSFNTVKCSLLRWAGVSIGRNVEIVSSAKFLGQGMNIEIGNNCYIGHEAFLFGARGSSIIIEDYAKVGSRTIIVTGSHRFSPDGYCIEKEGTFKNIKISTGAVVSTGSIILPGVTIYRMAHVAPGAVVSKDVPEFHRVGGVPARIIKDLRTEVL